jgi:hypothetical protein
MMTMGTETVRSNNDFEMPHPSLAQSPGAPLDSKTEIW